MKFLWPKQYMPRSLYGRAALILVLPVVVLQLVVSVAFLHHHLEGVTSQMTGTVIRELHMIADQIETAPDQQTLLRDMAPLLDNLQIQLRFVEPAEVPGADQRFWYDFSGRVVQDALRRSAPETLATLFPDRRKVLFYFASDLGPVEVTFGRRSVSVSAPHQLIVTMVFFGILMTVIAFLYLRNQLRPITRLASAAQAFGRGHNVPYRPGGATEVRAAGSAFLDMRARIERHIEQRTMMLSGVSHDLRTPLTRLRLGLAMLDDTEAGPLLEDVNEMERMLNAFLEFSRDASEAEAEPVEPQALIRRIVKDARRAGRSVQLGEMRGQGTVMLRPIAIRRAVENLLGNAIRYGDRAEVSVVLTDKSLRIRVEDNGPGIAADQRNEAVKPFSRLDLARNQNRGGGVGLGLAIVADIARAHGGALRLGTSERLGGLKVDIVVAR